MSDSDSFQTTRHLIQRHCSGVEQRIWELRAQPNVKMLPDFGVLFVLATWSGPAIVMLELFGKALQLVDTRLKAFLVDIDALAERTDPDLGTLGGWGETFWLLNGKVFDQIVRPEKNYIESFVRKSAALLRTVDLGPKPESEI